jgi:hypothetical protein
MKIKILFFTCIFFTACSPTLISIYSSESTGHYLYIQNTIHSIEVSIQKAGNSINHLSDSIVNHIAVNKQKNKEAYQSALKADSITSVFINYVDSLKGSVEEIISSKGNDDIEAHNKMLIEGKKGKVLKEKINSTRVQLLSLLTKEEQQQVKSDLIAKDPSETLTWEDKFFKHSPAAAVVTILVKFKNDALNTKAQVLKQLSKRVEKE